MLDSSTSPASVLRSVPTRNILPSTIASAAMMLIRRQPREPGKDAATAVAVTTAAAATAAATATTAAAVTDTAAATEDSAKDADAAGVLQVTEPLRQQLQPLSTTSPVAHGTERVRKSILRSTGKTSSAAQTKAVRFIIGTKNSDRKKKVKGTCNILVAPRSDRAT
eukprot:8138-Heterococcus_DN1.PRE.3